MKVSGYSYFDSVPSIWNVVIFCSASEFLQIECDLVTQELNLKKLIGSELVNRLW